MRRGFFSRIIVDARRPVPASAAVKSYPNQHPTADPSAHIESTKKDSLTQQQTTSTDSEFRTASKPELPLMTRQEGNTSDSELSHPVTAPEPTGQQIITENRQAEVKSPKSPPELKNPEKASRLRQHESDISGGNLQDMNLTGARENSASATSEVRQATARYADSIVEQFSHRQKKEMGGSVKESEQALPIIFNPDIHQNDTQLPADCYSITDESSSNIEHTTEKTTFPEIHVDREAVLINQHEEDDHESVSTQEAVIAISHKDQVKRPAITAEPGSAPQVHIGQVEVVVIADRKEMSKQHAPSPVDDFSSRNYLRRL